VCGVTSHQRRVIFGLAVDVMFIVALALAAVGIAVAAHFITRFW
jgi:hypothetical protein